MSLEDRAASRLNRSDSCESLPSTAASASIQRMHLEVGTPGSSYLQIMEGQRSRGTSRRPSTIGRKSTGTLSSAGSAAIEDIGAGSPSRESSRHSTSIEMLSPFDHIGMMKGHSPNVSKRPLTGVEPPRTRGGGAGKRVGVDFDDYDEGPGIGGGVSGDAGRRKSSIALRRVSTFLIYTPSLYKDDPSTASSCPTGRSWAFCTRSAPWINVVHN